MPKVYSVISERANDLPLLTVQVLSGDRAGIRVAVCRQAWIL